MVCIVTDGKNNASHEYTRDGIKSIIRQCENDNWNFIFLAANQNAFEVGNSFGMSYGNTYTFAGTAQGVAGMSAMMNNATVSYRSMNSNSESFKTKSKSLIDDDKDKKEPENSNTTTITSTNGNNTITNQK